MYFIHMLGRDGKWRVTQVDNRRNIKGTIVAEMRRRPIAQIQIESVYTGYNHTLYLEK